MVSGGDDASLLLSSVRARYQESPVCDPLPAMMSTLRLTKHRSLDDGSPRYTKACVACLTTLAKESVPLSHLSLLGLVLS